MGRGKERREEAESSSGGRREGRIEVEGERQYNIIGRLTMSIRSWCGMVVGVQSSKHQSLPWLPRKAIDVCVYVHTRDYLSSGKLTSSCLPAHCHTVLCDWYDVRCMLHTACLEYCLHNVDCHKDIVDTLQDLQSGPVLDDQLRRRAHAIHQYDSEQCPLEEEVGHQAVEDERKAGQRAGDFIRGL